MITRSLLTRTAAAVLAVSMTALALPAQAALPAERDELPAIKVGVPTLLGTAANPDLCLTFVAAEKVPIAVMLQCNPAPTAYAQFWTYTSKGKLQVTLSKHVGGDIKAACLDTGADLVKPPSSAPVMVLPCRNGDGQRWKYHKSTGALVNVATGQALNSLAGLRNQAKPVGVDPVKRSNAQAWLPLPIPSLDIIGAVMALLNAILKALGIKLPLPIAEASHQLFEDVSKTIKVPDQIKVLPRQILDLVY